MEQNIHEIKKDTHKDCVELVVLQHTMKVIAGIKTHDNNRFRGESLSLATKMKDNKYPVLYWFTLYSNIMMVAD